MTVAVLAEKPSVARDIARVLGARSRRNGALVGNGYTVTWAIGHLASLAQPHEIESQWKRWNLDELPMIPDRWPLRVYDGTRDQFEIVKRILCDPETDSVVCATDAGREGELIFRFIYEAAGSTKPVQRLWISSLTDDAIRRGFSDLKPASEFDGLADAARGRSRADWLVGMNLSRAYTLRQQGSRDVLSVGRVQTPTLAMLVERELTIRDFVPEPYREVRAVFSTRPDTVDADDPASTYEGVYIGDADPASSDRPSLATSDPEDPSATQPREASTERTARRLPANGDEARQIAERALQGAASVESISGRQRRIPPPLLYDLTELQRHANRIYGLSAKQTLDHAQSLYEKKLLSYPRTDSRALTRDIAATLPEVVAAIAQPYAGQLAAGTGARALGARFVDDAKVGEHHALIPTATSSSGTNLSRGEQLIYDLVCRRLLCAWHEDHLYSTTSVITSIVHPDLVDRYRSAGSKVDREGWRTLDPARDPARDPPRPTTSRKSGDPERPTGRSAAAADQQLPAELRSGMPVRVLESFADEKQTRPPRRFTEGSLLTAMETAGRTLDDKGLSDAMRERGLGTPATRAGIIETLLAREYLRREKKTLVATEKGIRLIELVHPHSKSPGMTGEWEAELRRIQEGSGTLERFMSRIETFVREVVAHVKQDALQASVESPPAAPTTPATASETTRSTTPRIESTASTANAPTSEHPVARGRPDRTATPADQLSTLLRGRFGFEQFRPHQEEVCRHITEGENVLLVMPTGAGKSLCYQLPGIARAGTTLVVSPLIALMEDQVAQLQARGFAAERIHSGRSREQSRAVCHDYLSGDLDFLFIAPERLSVPGFPEMLARRKPELIAIDEAHCISQWGHDFRPDYRRLKEHLSLLRPAPIAALTATATPRVQADIVEQLGVPGVRQFIHGFRRENIAIEVVELKPSLRNDTTARLLEPMDRRPAIVYAPTRKKAEALADDLGEAFPTAAYHAGMDSARRDKVQSAFLGGSLDVVVATVAFGMGIDKPNVRTVVHLALPGSVESYYQEIGRAGRDGLPSRAFLLHGYIDRRTHEWFLKRDYPDPKLLAKLYAALDETPIDKAVLQRKVGRAAGLNGEAFDRVLEKLWIHGGALVTPEEAVSKGDDRWRAPYLAQLEHRRAQIDEMARFADSHSCRMLRLVRHFGDQADPGSACGQCDICAPTATVAASFAEATPAQRGAMERILKTLAHAGTPSSGRLHGELFGDGFERDKFEALLAALHRAGYLHIEEESFENEGRLIEFRRPVITPSGRRATADDIAEVRVANPAESKPRRRRRKKSTRSRSRPGSKTAKSSRKKKSKAPSVKKLRPAREAGQTPLHSPASSALRSSLRDLRLAEARRRGIPAFRIFSDNVLDSICATQPATSAELIEIKGVGPSLAKKYGAEILRHVAEHRAP